MISKYVMMFRYRIEKAYKRVLDKMGFTSPIPVTVKRLYDEYVALFGKDVDIEQFYDMLIRVARAFGDMTISYHPLYYNEIEKWYVIIHRIR